MLIHCQNTSLTQTCFNCCKTDKILDISRVSCACLLQVENLTSPWFFWVWKHKTYFLVQQQHSSLSAMESPAWSSPAILRQPPLPATARAFLPSNPRLNAISEANNFLSADNQPGDDEVFDCVGVESSEEVSLLQQDGQNLVRKKSYHSRQGSRRQRTSSVEDWFVFPEWQR